MTVIAYTAPLYLAAMVPLLLIYYLIQVSHYTTYYTTLYNIYYYIILHMLLHYTTLTATFY